LIEGRRWLETALNLRFENEPPLRARALEAASDLAGSQGDFENASRLAKESAALFRSLDDDDGLARALRLEGWWAACKRDNKRARRLLQQSHVLAPDEGLTLERLGAVALNERLYTEAKSFFEQGLTAFHAHGDAMGAAGPRIGFGLVALAEQRIGDAAQHFRTALLELQELGGSGWGISYCLEGLAAVEVAEEQPARAASLLAKAEALRDDILHPLDPFEQEVHAHTLQRVHDRLDQASRAQASALGKALSLQDAITFALYGDRDHPDPAGNADGNSSVE
jgi:tetratricopeptide (TPR) repeat protein